MSVITLIKSYCDDIEIELEAKDDKIDVLKNKIEEQELKIDDLEQQLAELEMAA